MTGHDADRFGEATEGAGTMDEQPDSAPPTTAGTGPGGAPTGLSHGTGWPDQIGGAAGVASGGAPPVGATGGTGTGAGGLATGPVGTGGTRNLPHGAGRPAYGTTESEIPDPGTVSTLDVDAATTPSSNPNTPPD